MGIRSFRFLVSRRAKHSCPEHATVKFPNIVLLLPNSASVHGEPQAKVPTIQLEDKFRNDANKKIVVEHFGGDSKVSFHAKSDYFYSITIKLTKLTPTDDRSRSFRQ